MSRTALNHQCSYLDNLFD